MSAGFERVHDRTGIQVQVPVEVAERFHRAMHKHSEEAGGVADNIDTDTHKTGTEPVTERARNLTAVAEEKMKTEGTGETRTPDVGFPAKEEVEQEGPLGQPEGQL